MALGVRRIEHLHSCSLCTEAATDLIAKINEVFTPNLDGCIPIFGSVTRIKRPDACRRVISVQNLIDGVTEVSNHGDLDRNLIRTRNGGRVVAL